MVDFFKKIINIGSKKDEKKYIFAYEYSNENKKYIVNMEIKDKKIIIIIEEKLEDDLIIPSKYKSEFSKELISERNIYFSSFSDIESIFDFFKVSFIENKIILSKINEDTDLLQMKITFTKGIVKEDEIKLYIPKIDINTKSILEHFGNYISSITDELNTKIMKLSNSIDSMKKELENKDKKINDLENDKILMQNEIKKLKNDINEMRTQIKDGVLVPGGGNTFSEEFDHNLRGLQIGKIVKDVGTFEKLKRVLKLTNCNPCFKLIYTGNMYGREGDLNHSFNEICKNKKPLLVLCNNNNGEIFGGYTELGVIDQTNQNDNGTYFIFNLAAETTYTPFEKRYGYNTSYLYGFYGNIDKDKAEFYHVFKNN